MRHPIGQPLPRGTHTFDRVVSKWLSNNGGFVLRLASIAFGVVLPGLGFFFLVLGTPQYAWILAVCSTCSIVALMRWTMSPPPSACTARILAGALWTGAVFGTGFCVWVLFVAVNSDFVPAVIVFGPVPLAGTIVYVVNAARATWSSRAVDDRYLWLGAGLPVVLGVVPQVVLALGQSACVNRMLSRDRAVAMEAAKVCDCLPRRLVTWQPIVDAWISAKGGRAWDPETPRSNQIADVFQQLTDHDLRRYYDDSGSY